MQGRNGLRAGRAPTCSSFLIGRDPRLASEIPFLVSPDSPIGRNLTTGRRASNSDPIMHSTQHLHLFDDANSLYGAVRFTTATASSLAWLEMELYDTMYGYGCVA